MTRLFGSNVLLDKATADKLVERDDIKTQLLMRVKPYGLRSSTEVYRLLLANSPFDDQHMAEYNAALADFSAGNWSVAKSSFSKLKRKDAVAGFLCDYIDKFSALPPRGWNGTIAMETK